MERLQILEIKRWGQNQGSFCIRIEDHESFEFEFSKHKTLPSFVKIHSENHPFWAKVTELSLNRYGNSICYELELHQILFHFLQNKTPPPLPVVLGETSFDKFRPNLIRIWINKVFGLFKWGQTYNTKINSDYSK